MMQLTFQITFMKPNIVTAPFQETPSHSLNSSYEIKYDIHIEFQSHETIK